MVWEGVVWEGVQYVKMRNGGNTCIVASLLYTHSADVRLGEGEEEEEGGRGGGSGEEVGRKGGGRGRKGGVRGVEGGGRRGGGRGGEGPRREVKVMESILHRSMAYAPS